MCRCILRNILLWQSQEDVEDLLQVLRNEGLDGAILDDDACEDAAGGGGAKGVPEEAPRTWSLFDTLTLCMTLIVAGTHLSLSPFC